MTFAPWQPLTVRPDELSLGGIAVEGDGADLVRAALRSLYDRLRAVEDERDELAHHLNPRIVVDDELGPELEAFNAADPHCERCAGLGRLSVGVDDGAEVRVELVPCSCVEEHR